MGESLSVPDGELRVVDSVPEAFAGLVAEEIQNAFAAPGNSSSSFRPNSSLRPNTELFRLVLSGGSTARSCYEELARWPGIDWSLVECLVGDERCVPADDEDANQRMIRESLVDRVVPSPRFHPMDCTAGPQAYEAVLTAGAGLDLVHLGLGPDGHTASLFAGSTALGAPPESLVGHNEDPSGRNPHRRLTLTLAGIALARLVVFTVAGPDKHEAMLKVLAHEDLPATRVRAGRVIWLCDRPAMGA